MEYKIGDKFLCLTNYSYYLTKGKIYPIFRDCNGNIGILDNQCEIDEYEVCWNISGSTEKFVRASKAMKILYGFKEDV